MCSRLLDLSTSKRLTTPLSRRNQRRHITQLPVLSLVLSNSRSPALSLPLGRCGESLHVRGAALLSKACASYTSRVVRGRRYAGRHLPGVENRSPPIHCMSPIVCECTATAIRSLSLPAPRVITWVALGGLEELSFSLLGFYFSVLFQALPFFHENRRCLPRQAASLQLGSLSQDRTNTPPPATCVQGSECQPVCGFGSLARPPPFFTRARTSPTTCRSCTISTSPPFRGKHHRIED